jgi:hypothetical protein
LVEPAHEDTGWQATTWHMEYGFGSNDLLKYV